tara:strand:+ start:416 stop:715 length:300 start_codon:yes stop_codon:yes gene_type:complete
LNAHNIPRPEIDRIALIMWNHHLSPTTSNDVMSRIGGDHIEVVRVFIALQKEKRDCFKRIRDFAESENMEGEDSVTRRARTITLLHAVSTLSVMPYSSR